MKGFLSHYTPSLMNPEDLDAIFVQRDRLLTDLLENIENSILTEAKHHALLIGPRGIGKTHLISMIYHRVSANETFKDKLKIAWLREEEWGVATFLDLLVRILNSLIEEYKDANLEEKIKDLYSVSMEQAEQLAGHILKQYCQAQTLLLLMENLDEIFKGLDESGQQAFRAYLQNYGFISIVATSQSLFSGVKSRDLPFYGFFSLTHLKPLVVKEAVDLLAKIAKWQGDQDLADLLLTPLGDSRIGAIHHLAGGNHRIYIIFSQFLTTESLDSLVEPFMKMLDNLTPFYQSRMQFISPQQRKIIEYLCEQRRAITVKEIAQHCFISPQTASSQLKQLRDMGYVYADAQGRESFYELQEPLMRICLEAKKRRGTPNQLFISFLRIWFSREELEKRLEILPLEASFDRECTLKALAEGELNIVRNSGMDYIRKAEVHYWLGQKEESKEALEKAVQLEAKNDLIWSAKGHIEEYMGELDTSIESYKKAIDLNANNSEAWSGKAISEGLLYRRLFYQKDALADEKKQETIKSIETFEKLDSQYITPDSLSMCSYAYEVINEHEKGLECIDKALSDDSENDWYLERKASILRFLPDREKEALTLAEKAVALNPNSFFNQSKLGEIYYLLGKYKEALISVEKSISLHNVHSFSWLLKGLILSASNPQKLIDIIESYHKSIVFEKRFSHGINLDIALENIKSLSWCITIHIFKLGTTQKAWFEYSKSICKIYAQHNLLDDLSGGLVESIKAINESSTSDHTAQAWLEMWQNLAGKYDEFQIALNLLKVAVEYKINSDRRVLLQLPQEERQILEELLNPETL